MQTQHKIVFSDARDLSEVQDASVDLVVTSPPYPMIEMWDKLFAQQNPQISTAVQNGQGDEGFELMHQELDKVWSALYRVVAPGGMVCINIGDATRTLQKAFKLYPNHARIINSMLQVGFTNLPNILWRKQTNAPNKFMGSGMLPPGAYVTLEHEYILLFRKGQKRLFTSPEAKKKRKESAYFWEERNQWFSDLWDLKGTRQNLMNNKSRERSAAFPFELAYRLINMFSVQHDTVLDPFLGTGTTTLAAMASGRNSLGIELEEAFATCMLPLFKQDLVGHLNKRIRKRIRDHIAFAEKRKEEKGADAFKHHHPIYDFPVVTAQEKGLVLHYLEGIDFDPERWEISCSYLTKPIRDKFERGSLFAETN